MPRSRVLFVEKTEMRSLRKHLGGFTIIETTVAGVILAAILAAVVPMMVLVQSQQIIATAQRQALSAADNLLERALALDWAEIQSDVADEEIGASEVLSGVPGGEWTLTVIDEAEGVPAKRVTLTVSYAARGQAGSVQLTAWAFEDP